MRVLVTGASGFIGHHLVCTLLHEGHEVVACVRKPDSYRKRFPGIPAIGVDYVHDTHPHAWQLRLKGIDAVINTVGIIHESGGNTFHALHRETPIALFKACEQVGVKKVIQISALGADDSAFSQYHMSKKAADDYLAQTSLDWVIVLPSIVYGPGAKSMQFFKILAALPITPLVDKGDQPLQPIHITDVCHAVLQLLVANAPSKLRIPFVGPLPITMRNLLAELKQWLGSTSRRFVSIPYQFSLLVAKLGGFLGTSPMNQDTVMMLKQGNTGDIQLFTDTFGFTPIRFEEALRDTPAQQSDLWHAQLVLLKPFLRISIAFVWIYTAIVSAFIYPKELSYVMLSWIGITGLLATVTLYSASLFDFLLGIATLTGYRINIVGMLQIMTIALYTVIISIGLPEQWVHPFGPISKNLPLLVSILVMMVLEKR